MQIVTGIERIIENCFTEVREIWLEFKASNVSDFKETNFKF